MLVLSRKLHESVVIDDEIEVEILEISDGKVKLGIKAPGSVAIHRKEVYEEIAKENVTALDSGTLGIEKLKKINKK